MTETELIFKAIEIADHLKQFNLASSELHKAVELIDNELFHDAL